MWKHLWKSLQNAPVRLRHSNPSNNRVSLLCEALEERFLLSTFVWTWNGKGNNNWDNAANWKITVDDKSGSQFPGQLNKNFSDIAIFDKKVSDTMLC